MSDFIPREWDGTVAFILIGVIALCIASIIKTGPWIAEGRDGEDLKREDLNPGLRTGVDDLIERHSKPGSDY